MSPRISIIYIRAGGGHKASAEALAFKLKDSWEVQLVDLRSVLSSIDFVEKYFSISIEQLYNKTMSSSYGYLLASKTGLKLLGILIKSRRKEIIRLMQEYWKSTKPNLIVSVIPHFNKYLYESAENTPYVTIATDMADVPPHFWIEDQDQYFIAGTDKLYNQALGTYSSKNVFKVNGMMINPNFYDLKNRNSYPTSNGILICFGGFGSIKMLKLARNMRVNCPDVKSTWICGHSNKLKEKIILEGPVGSSVFGFVSGLPRLMSASDFAIGKPGPGFISEAIVSGLPVLLDNTNIMIQERYNLQWVEEMGVGSGFDINSEGAYLDILKLINNLQDYKRNVSKIKIDAINEIPQILRSLI